MIRMRAKRGFPWGNNGETIEIGDEIDATEHEASALRAMEWAEEVDADAPPRPRGRPRTRQMQAQHGSGYLTK